MKEKRSREEGTMANAKMIVSEESWKNIPESERSWLIYYTVINLQQRVEKIEKRRWWDGAKVFAGGLFGGAAATLGINIGGFGK